MWIQKICKNKKIYIGVGALLLIVIILVLCSRVELKGGYNANKKEYEAAKANNITKASKEKASVYDMKVYAENDKLAMFVRESDGLIGILEKASGNVYFTSPYEADEDPFASPYYKKQMKASVAVKFYNENVQAMEMDTYTNAILEDQFEIKQTDNGADILYTIGETAVKYILPKAIDEERFDLYFSKMSDDGKKQVKRNYTHLVKEELKSDAYKEYLEKYPSLEKKSIWIMKDVQDYKKEELATYFIEAGYTVDDLISDTEENCAEAGNDKPWFVINVKYRLEDDAFVAEIDNKSLAYNTEFYLTDIILLPYFGAADSTKNGYMFVPDGSGALIYLNNGKKDHTAYSGMVYGSDIALDSTKKNASDADESLSAKLPVYGMKEDEKAWLAVIDKGNGYATINADISGKTSSYNKVYTSFSYLRSGSISLGDIIGSRSFYMYSEKPSENFEVRYFFLDKENADYSGMAVRYRKYLEAEGAFKNCEVEDEIPFYAEYIGAIDKVQSMLGVKYTATRPLTSFEQAEKITQMFIDRGVGNIKVVYYGWSEGGIEGVAPTVIKAESKLNKQGVSLKKLDDFLDEKGITLFPMIDLQHVYKTEAFDRFSVQKNAPRYFDRSIVRTGEKAIVTGAVDEYDTELISPYYVSSLADILIRRMKGYKLETLGIASLPHELYSDLASGKTYMDRQDAIYANADAARKLSEKYERGLLADNSNDYMFSYLSDIVDAPLDSNGFRVFDESVPFYEMVLKGHISFAGKPLNLADDHTTQLLKSVESGAGLAYKLIYEDNSLIKGTDYDEYYSVNYQTWLDIASEEWKKVSEVCEGLAGKCIVKHEKVGNDVYKVTYENGGVIAVNYSNEDVVVDGITVGSKDFARIRK